MKKTPSVSCAPFCRRAVRSSCLVSHLVHHRGVPRLSLRPIRRDLNLRLLDRRAQSRRLLCARDRVHASHVSHRARRSIHDVLHSIAHSFIHSRTRASPSSRTFPRRAHDGLRLLLRDHELGDPIRARRVHDRPLERSPSPSPVSSLESRVSRSSPTRAGFHFFTKPYAMMAFGHPRTRARARKEVG